MKQIAKLGIFLMIFFTSTYCSAETNISKLREAVKVDPQNAKAHVSLANALDNEDSFDEAVKEYQEAIRLKPNNAMAHYNLGLCYHRKNILDDAIKGYMRAIEIFPNYSSAYHNLGLIYKQKGNKTQVQKQADELRRLNRNDQADDLTRGPLFKFLFKPRKFYLFSYIAWLICGLGCGVAYAKRRDAGALILLKAALLAVIRFSVSYINYYFFYKHNILPYQWVLFVQFSSRILDVFVIFLLIKILVISHKEKNKEILEKAEAKIVR